MGTPFLAEIRIMGFNFPPKGWAFCNGQFMPINQNQALFSLLGTTYGGNGQTTFALPNLQGRVPIHTGNGHTLGEVGGQEAHTVTIQEMPAHMHFLNATNSPGTASIPGGSILAGAPSNVYGAFQNIVPMGTEAVSSVGGSQPHENRQPYIVLNFCIALQGVFPSRN